MFSPAPNGSLQKLNYLLLLLFYIVFLLLSLLFTFYFTMVCIFNRRPSVFFLLLLLLLLACCGLYLLRTVAVVYVIVFAVVVDNFFYTHFNNSPWTLSQDNINSPARNWRCCTIMQADSTPIKSSTLFSSTFFLFTLQKFFQFFSFYYFLFFFLGVIVIVWCWFKYFCAICTCTLKWFVTHATQYNSVVW